MTFQEIQEKLKKCELALTSIKNGTYSNTNFTQEEALEKFTTIKESLEKKLNLLKEEETMFVSTKGGDTKAVQMDTKAAMDLKKDPNITGITTAKGKDLKEDDLSDEEQEEITTETSHTEVVAKEVHKALIDALQETGHEVSEDNLSSLNPETFTITVRFKDNTQSDYSFEFVADEVKLDGNIIVTTNKKGVTPILNKTIAKDNLVKYFKNLSEKKGKDLDGDGDVDSDDYMIARDRAIKANMKEEESEPVVDKKGKYTGVRRLKLSDRDKATLKKIEDLLAKEKNENINEENYDYYTKPKHFDICPGAEALRDEVLASGKTAEELGKWTFKHDELFRLEKAVLKSNKADERHVKVAKELAGEITHHSRDLGIEANKIGYLKGHIKKIEDVANKTDGRGDNISLRSRDIYEGEGDDHHYIKVSRRDYKKAMSILDQNVDPTYVKMDVVDDDGAGNVVIYFIFKHEYGFDDMYDDPEGKENPELYQEPDEDPHAFVYDAVMDLQAQDVEVVDHSAELDENVTQKHIDDIEASGNIDIAYKKAMELLKSMLTKNEALDINDPALMRARVAKMRADDMKKLDAYKKSPEGRAAARAQASAERKEEKARALVQKLKAKRAEIEREMENDPDIEPEGGPVADMYGDQLNKIDNAIEKAASAYNKPMDYDTAVGKVSEEDEFAGSDPKAGSTIKGKGFMAPRTFVDPEDLTPAAMAKKKLNKESIQVGHPDNEPGMLKQDAYDIAHYAVKLYKLLKYYDSLEDQVDFPHWWQSKVVKAREYISKAAHYLEFKTNEPAIDANVDALQEGRSANAIKKEYDALVKKMIELAKEYKQAEGDKKQKLVDQLKDHTKKKKELEKELDQAVQKTGAGQELDTSINELSTDQRNDLIELQNILDDVHQKGEEAREIIRQSFPRMLSKADAYGAFDLGSSSNRYDTTLESIIEEIEEYYDEEEDLDENLTVVGHTPEEEKKNAEELVAVARKAGRDAKIAYYGDRIQGVDIGAPGLGTPDEVRAVQDRQFAEYDKNKPKDNKPLFKPKKLKKLKLGGKTYEIGDFDPNDDGRIMSIEKYPNGYFIHGGIYTDYGDGDPPKEAYGYAIDLKGNEMEDYDLEGMYEGLDEIGMFHDPIGYSSTAAAEDKRALQFVKDLINKGVNKEDAIEKAAEKFKLRVHYLTRYVDKRIDEAVTHDFEERIDQIVNHYFKGNQEVKKAAVEYASLKAARTMGGRAATASHFKDFFNNHSSEVANQAMEVIDMANDDVYQEGKYKSDAQRKAIYATKAEKGELKEEMDGGRLFDYFAKKGYDVKERSSDGRKPGFIGYQVTRGSDRYPQSVIFQYNKDTDKFTISRMGGYRIDQEEAIKAGMKEKGRSGAVGMDSWMTDGNWTPVSISAEGLKDIVDHVMTGIDRESKAQTDFAIARGRTSGTIDEKAPGFKHDCAAKVVHETYGVGICIPEKHTLIKEGSKYVVTHYDVLFKEGKKVVEDIPVEELQIVTQKEHWHKGYKKKKK